VATPLILYIGEVRDRECAKGIVRAASNGYLTIATGFSSDIISGLDSLVRLGGGDMGVGLANVLRLVIHQKLDGARRATATLLASANSATAVANRIRLGHLNQLQNDIQYQQNIIRMGAGDLFEAPGLQ
jgi:twitching motility protein PilT